MQIKKFMSDASSLTFRNSSGHHHSSSSSLVSMASSASVAASENVTMATQAMATVFTPEWLQSMPRPKQGEVTKYINVNNAKILALCLVIGFIVYHGFIRIKYGTDSCQWLLSDGRFQGHDNWQPYGCMMHKYTRSDIRNCMHYIAYWGGHNHIVFIGDSRIRQQYFQFMNMISMREETPHKAHSDLSFKDNYINLLVEFLWHPLVNDTMFNVYKDWVHRPAKSRPTLIVTGSATWHIKLNNASAEARENYKGNLSLLVPFLNQLGNSTKILWMLQDPVIESKLQASRSMITNTQLDEYNRAAIEKLSSSAAILWSSARLLAQGYNRDSSDGVHLGKVALEWDSQILFNMYCNDNMNFDDGTCCSIKEPITTIQIITASFFAFSFLVFLCMTLWQHQPNQIAPPKAGMSEESLLPSTQVPDLTTSDTESVSSNGEYASNETDTDEKHKEKQPGARWQSCYNLVSCLSRLGIILVYFFLCDRTNFFMKENKYYTHVNFFLPFSYLMILGFFFTENTDQTTVLHRDQTDEWKGWMQLVILIYHLTGASRVLSIYMQIRVLVTAYILLSGYGHFCYFWTCGDFSLHRFCKVMFRFNFLVVVLCFAMNRPYQFYYFVPLVSFWFLLLYVTMAIWPQVTAASVETNGLHYLYLVLKVAVLVVAMTLLYASEVFFEKIFLSHPIKALFVTSDDSIRDWRFRWKLDRYSTVYGVVIAFGLMLSKKMKVIDDSTSQSFFSRGLSMMLAFLAICGFLGYGTFASLCKNKQECNEVHPYISFIPIVSYIVLRNLFGWLRTKYSSFFAWFGRIALELFIAQYHIWLAADTHGVLVLVPSYPVLNVVITSFIYVCISHEIQSVTIILTDYMVPHDWKLLLRNVLIFILILIPIAITHGVLGV